MRRLEATSGHAETAGGWPRLGCASPLTGHGVAPLRNNSARTAGGCGHARTAGDGGHARTAGGWAVDSIGGNVL
ncbi:MAG: hypothetical protein LBD24_05385 [Spirochaetaceae bacterium]|nr:hypothetical protein [Spirochaetaceae bacterium]